MIFPFLLGNLYGGSRADTAVTLITVILAALLTLAIILFFILLYAYLLSKPLKVLFRWFGNNFAKPVSIDARVVTKRTAFLGENTLYYAAFEHDSDRVGDHFDADKTTEITEFRVRKGEYVSLNAGDGGRLTFKGTRYVKFERM